MSFLQDNIENCKIGFKGEETVRSWFIKKKIPFMQVDIMFKYKNKWCLGEVKTQEKYLSPPFDGHGLPQWRDRPAARPDCPGGSRTCRRARPLGRTGLIGMLAKS